MCHLSKHRMSCCEDRRALSMPAGRLAKNRRRSSVAQGVTRVTHEGEVCTIRQGEEFRANAEQGTVAKYLSDEKRLVARERGLNVPTLVGRRGYVPYSSHWRCGSGMTHPHSTHRTLPARCSSSETQSEIRRLCVQAWGGFIGGDCRARPDCSGFMAHLRGGRR